MTREQEELSALNDQLDEQDLTISYLRARLGDMLALMQSDIDQGRVTPTPVREEVLALVRRQLTNGNDERISLVKLTS